MKKLFLTVMMLLLVFKVDINAKEPKYKEVYDTLITTLNPYIHEEVDTYYGEFKQYDLFNIDLDIDRISGGYSFLVKVKLKTFEHSHNPPYGNDTITFRISPGGVEALKYDHIADKDELLIKDFTNEIIDDIKSTFNLELDGYTKYTHGQLYLQSYKYGKYDGLFKISSSIKKDILNEELNLPEQPYKNFIDPVTFIKDDEAIIMFKRSSGMNVIYNVNNVDDFWIVNEQLTKMGKKMDNLLLWYM